MEICIFAETVQLDQKSYEKLIERIFEEVFNLEAPIFRRLDNLIIRGKGDLVTHLPFNLRTITRKYPNISCIFVFLDADGKYPQKTYSEKKRVKEKIKTFIDSFPGEIIISVPTRNIESWLLGDNGNINYTTGLSTTTFLKTEEIEESKEKFKGIYTKYLNTARVTPLSYSDFVTQLFTTISFNILKSHSKTFKNLLKDIRSYLRVSGNI